jgi:hypothetical protein
MFLIFLIPEKNTFSPSVKMALNAKYRIRLNLISTAIRAQLFKNRGFEKSCKQKTHRKILKKTDLLNVLALKIKTG